MAIASFHKVYYTSKGLIFFLKQVSRVFRKIYLIYNNAQNSKMSVCVHIQIVLFTMKQISRVFRKMGVVLN